MKRQYFIFLFLLILILPGRGYSQNMVKTLDSLAVEIWPDYDQASVLVMLSGTLPADTQLPATVTFPFPKNAQLNAVARIDSGDGVMKDDIVYNQAPNEITFITPDLRFRLEYYLPYTINDNHHTFTFTWLAELSVDNFQIRIQQPLSASSLTTVPGTVNVSAGGDGFTYHAFPIQSVPAGQKISVKVDYTMTSPQLSVAQSAPQSSPQPPLAPPFDGKVGTHWLIVTVVIGLIIIAIILVWKTGSRRDEASRQVTPQAKSKAGSASRFCTKCGNPTDKEDKFCSKCGSALKGKG